MKTLAQKIEIMQAAQRGETIEMQYLNRTGGWLEPSDQDKIAWNWDSFDYRVKPKAPREFWINIYPDQNPGNPHTTKHFADACARSGDRECVLFREVIQ